MQINEVYNPRLIITEHFYQIKNQLDINVETIFDQKRLLDEKQRDEINTTREKQISKIEEIEQENLSQWLNEFDQNKFEEKWKDLLSDTSLENFQKFEKIKEKIIKRDAILIDNVSIATQISLWVIPMYVNKLNLELLK